MSSFYQCIGIMTYTVIVGYNQCMAQLCIKCNIYHNRPVGTRCLRLRMATNITPTQAIMASMAVLSPSVNPVVSVSTQSPTTN